MKKAFYIGVFLALAICTGCRDRSYQGLDPLTPNEEIEIEKIPILLAVGDPSYSLLTRSLGAFDSLMSGKADTLVRNKATFYIYAFAKDNEVDFSKRASDASNNPDKDICLVDGTLNNTPEYDHGKTAVFNQDDYTFLNWADGAAYYNTVHQTRPYNFYAYYVDSMIINQQMPGTVERKKDYIAFPVKIDGRMDLMSAVAAVTEDQQKNILDKITTEKEKNAMNECRYSAYTAHRGLYPFFTFKHHMAKMHFNLYAGDSITIDRVFLDTIQVYVNTVGKFTVVHKDESQIGITDWNTPEWLLLKEKDGSDLHRDYQAIWHTENNDKDKEVYDRTPTPVGDCLLIPPSDSINIEIYFRQEERGKEGEEKPEIRYFVTKQTITPKDAKGNKLPFTAGYAYNLRIAVFGELEIKISAAIEGWKIGGDIDINPDADFQF